MIKLFYKHLGRVRPLLIVCLFSIARLNAENNPTDIPFYILSIPKSGTHLIIKLAYMLTYLSPFGLHHLYPMLPQVPLKDFEKAILDCKVNNQFPFNHLNNFAELFRQFSLSHPEYVKILMIRDLRDMLTSYAYHISDNLDERFGKMDFDQKLTMILDIQNYEVGHEYRQELIHAVELLSDPHLKVIRFEDIIGLKGGGDQRKQSEAIKYFANLLRVDLTEEKLNHIIENLHGNDIEPKLSGTFRLGEIGSWKSHFKVHHKQLFQQHWKFFNQAFGYPLD